MGDSRNYEINTKFFQVQNNIMWFSDYFIQLSSIAQVSSSPKAKQAYPNFIYVLLGFGGLLLLLGNSSVKLVGIVLIVVGAYFIYKIHQSNNTFEQDIHIELNSGSVFHLRCQSKDRAEEVMQALRKCIETRNANVTIFCDGENVMIGDYGTQINKR